MAITILRSIEEILNAAFVPASGTLQTVFSVEEILNTVSAVNGALRVSGGSTVIGDSAELGAWDSLFPYSSGSAVWYDNTIWRSLQANSGVEPGTNDLVWVSWPQSSDIVRLGTVGLPQTDVESALVYLASQINGFIQKDTFDANTILKADSDNLPVVLTVAEDTLVGRVAGDVIDALTPTEVQTLLNIEDGADVTYAVGEDGAIQYSTSNLPDADNDFKYIIADKALNVYNIDFTVPTVMPTYKEGRVFWDHTHDALAFYDSDPERLHQVGQEVNQIVYNSSVTETIANGQPVYLDGTGPADPSGITFPIAKLAIANHITKSKAIGIATHDIEPLTWGKVTRLGPVHDVDTTGWAVPTILYLSDTVAGLLTPDMPESPNYRVIIGSVFKTGTLDGTIGVNVQWLGNTQSATSILNGSTLETVKITVYEDTGVVYCEIENYDPARNVWCWFDNVPYEVDTTPAIRVALTAGTDTDPVLNFVYITTTGVLTSNTTGFPSVQHAPITRVKIYSVARTAADGAKMVHGFTNHLKDANNLGHLDHIQSWMRAKDAEYKSGIDITISGSPGATPQFSLTAGVVSQLHLHTTPIFNAGHHFYVVNDPTIPNRRAVDFSVFTVDSTGASINNRYAAIVLYVTVSENETDSQACFLLPSGSYLTEADARSDSEKYTNYQIPNDEVGAATLCYRLIIRNAGGTITVFGTGYTNGDDIRGLTPGTVGGSSSTLVTTFSSALFRVYDATNPDQFLAFDCSGIDPATTRSLTIPNQDGTIALTSDIVPAPVTSVFGRTGVIVATAGDYDDVKILISDSAIGANIPVSVNTLYDFAEWVDTNWSDLGNVKTLSTSATDNEIITADSTQGNLIQTGSGITINNNTLTFLNAGSLVTGSDYVVRLPKLENPVEKFYDLGKITNGSIVFNVQLGNFQKVEVGANSTITFSNMVIVGYVHTMVIEFINANAYTLTWPAAVTIITGQTTISVDATDDSFNDSALGFGTSFIAGDSIVTTGFSNSENNGTFPVIEDGTTGKVKVLGDLITEAAGASVSIYRKILLTPGGTLPDFSAGASNTWIFRTDNSGRTIKAAPAGEDIK